MGSTSSPSQPCVWQPPCGCTRSRSEPRASAAPPRPNCSPPCYVPDERFSFADAEEVFNALTDDEDERGLGALDVIQGRRRQRPNRYAAGHPAEQADVPPQRLSRATPELSYELVWDGSHLASKGAASTPSSSSNGPTSPTASLVDMFGDVDQRRSNRLVVLDPRRWTLLNGRDSATRADIEAILGLGPTRLARGLGRLCRRRMRQHPAAGRHGEAGPGCLRVAAGHQRGGPAARSSCRDGRRSTPGPRPTRH